MRKSDDRLAFHFISYQMAVKFYMFSPFTIHWVKHNLHGTDIICMKESRIDYATPS